MEDYAYSYNNAVTEYEDDKEKRLYAGIRNYLYLYLVITNHGLGEQKWVTVYDGEAYGECGKLKEEEIENCATIKSIAYDFSERKEIPYGAYKALFQLVKTLGEYVVKELKYNTHNVPKRLNLNNCFKFMDIVMNCNTKDYDVVEVFKNGLDAFCDYINYLNKSDYIDRDFSIANLIRPFSIIIHNSGIKRNTTSPIYGHDFFEYYYNEEKELCCYDLLMDLANGEYVLKTPEYASLYKFPYLDNKNYVQVALVKPSIIFKNIRKGYSSDFDKIIDYLKELSRVSKKIQCCKVLQYLDFTNPSSSYKDLSKLESDTLDRLKELYSYLTGKTNHSYCDEKCKDFVNNLSIILYSCFYEVRELVNKNNNDYNKSLELLYNYLKIFVE